MAFVAELDKTVGRASALTRQLLTVSRQQILRMGIWT